MPVYDYAAFDIPFLADPRTGAFRPDESKIQELGAQGWKWVTKVSDLRGPAVGWIVLFERLLDPVPAQAPALPEGAPKGVKAGRRPPGISEVENTVPAALTTEAPITSAGG